LDTVTDDELADGLYAWAEGSHLVEAAVGLLAAHRSWLCRRDFRQRAICVDPAGDPDDPFWVGIDWDAAARVLAEVPASSGERAILAIAVALAAGSEHPVDLSEALGSLDGANSGRVLQAIAHAAGLHERHLSLVIDGRFDE
jgi:hypothetical protein